MMKKFKKIFAAIAASALVAAMSFTSMAASITINSGETEGTDKTSYTYYKILNANILYNEKKEIQNVSYYVTNSDLADKITATGLFEVTKSADGTRWNVVAKENTTDAEAIAKAFDNNAILNNDAVKSASNNFAQDKKTVDGKETVQAVATGLSDGYYLIKSSLGTVLAVQTTGDEGVTITEKNKYPKLVKTRDKETASYGEKIEYSVVVSIPATAAAKDIIVVDTMTSGLTPFDSDDEDNLLDVTATVDGNELTQEKAVTVISQSNNVIKIKIPEAAVKEYKGKQVTLTYHAVLNNNAKPAKAESNSAYLTYANYTSLISSVDVTTYGFELTKVDGAKKNDTVDRYIPAAAGDAKFTLYKTEGGNDKIYVVKDEDTNTYQITTNVTDTKILAGGINHDATIVGLAAGTYYLQEDEAPTGYNKLAERKPITVVSGENAAAENKVEVENNAGIKLPSTGGMGTTVFAIVGLLVMAGAAVTLIVKKRA